MKFDGQFMGRARPVWMWLSTSVVVPFALLAVGFRILYDSVIPEVAGLVVIGAVFGYVRPRFVWLSVIGIAFGILLSQRVFPVAPSAEHIAQYGAPVKGGLGGFLMLCAVPAVPALIGALARKAIDPGQGA